MSVLLGLVVVVLLCAVLGGQFRILRLLRAHYLDDQSRHASVTQQLTSIHARQQFSTRGPVK
jgi:hypothetical protein